MKTVYIIHGWDGSPEEPTFKWLGSQLKEKGYRVIAPNMPNPEKPEIEAWVGKLKKIASPDPDSIFVGYSIGCQAVLRYLETLTEEIKIGGVVLIAPWMRLDEKTIEEEGEEVREIAKPWMETPIDFTKIKSLTKNITAIFSDNDPYVPLSQKDIFEKELGANIIIEHKKGHFDQSGGVDKLPSALDAILKMST